MVGARRSSDWGFPRWRGYGSSREAQTVRLCDRHGCDDRGECPAPKSPNSPQRWYFCEKHAAEYNRGWDYFEGLSKEEAAARARAEQTETSGYKESVHHQWAGSGDGSRSADEMRALDVLGLEVDADLEMIKKSYRLLAKQNHPDTNPDDEDAAQRFQAIQLSYQVLKSAAERREWKPAGE